VLECKKARGVYMANAAKKVMRTIMRAFLRDINDFIFKGIHTAIALSAVTARTTNADQLVEAPDSAPK
jgi:hypothetical protein